MGFSANERKFIRRLKNKRSKIGNAVFDWAEARRGLMNKKKAQRKARRAMRTRNGN